MRLRRQVDVSTEAFLIRLAKVSDTPVSVFFASAIEANDGRREYRVDYSVSSAFAPILHVEGTNVPQSSVLRNCTAIGHTDRATETWFAGIETPIEYVGIPGYPGSRYPRVAGIVRFGTKQPDKQPIRYAHGNVVEPLDDGKKIICQLVNDRAVKWGGGVARKFARKFPDAEAQFTQNLIDMKPSERLGRAIFTQLSPEDVLASIIAQEGFGPSMFSRLRYSALQSGLRVVASMASNIGASIHMPRIGTGAAGGDWGVIEEIIEEEMVRSNLTVTIYDLPPRREQFELFS
jgi:O-acetyl-ADP-ribose deacetylase (regulator of RNase III)